MLAYGVYCLQEGNQEEGLLWMKRSEEAGEIRATTLLGGMYVFGHLVDQNIPKGLRKLEQAGSKDDVVAQTALGLLYLGKQELVHKVAETYKKSFGSSADKIPPLTVSDIHVDRQPDNARKWLRRASEGGNAEAQHNLAVLCLELGTKSDIKEAIEWLTVAGNDSGRKKKERKIIKKKDNEEKRNIQNIFILFFLFNSCWDMG